MKTDNKISLIFRVLGSVVLITGIVQFLLSGRYDLNSYFAHNLFLGLNIILCTLGVISAKKYQDNKTARTFITLSLGMLPTQFSQLGAFIYNRFHGIPTEIPEMAQLALPDSVGLLSVSVLTGMILLPILLLGFHVINRQEAKTLSIFYSLQSAVLLLPIRENNYMCFIALAMLGSLYLLSRNLKPAKTFEFKLSRSLLFIPSFLVIGRGLMYNDATLMLAIALYLFAYFAMFALPEILKSLSYENLVGTLLYRIGNISTLTATSLICFNFKIGFVPTFLILAMTSYAMGVYGRLKDRIAIVFGHFLFCMAGFMFIDQYSLVWQYVYLILPAIGTYLNFQAKNKVGFGIQAINFLTLFVVVFSQSFRFTLLANWQSLSFIGILMIIVGAVYERKSEDLKAKLNYMTQHFN